MRIRLPAIGWMASLARLLRGPRESTVIDRLLETLHFVTLAALRVLFRHDEARHNSPIPEENGSWLRSTISTSTTSQASRSRSNATAARCC
jgi:hypothetical protein